MWGLYAQIEELKARNADLRRALLKVKNTTGEEMVYRMAHEAIVADATIGANHNREVA